MKTWFGSLASDIRKQVWQNQWVSGSERDPSSINKVGNDIRRHPMYPHLGCTGEQGSKNSRAAIIIKAGTKLPHTTHMRSSGSK